MGSNAVLGIEAKTERWSVFIGDGPESLRLSGKVEGMNSDVCG